MIHWILRPVLALSGIIAGWFVAQDALNFSVVQTMISLILIVILIGAAAFWPQRWTDWLQSLFRRSSN